MKKHNFTIPYTICYCIHKNSVLMLYRFKPPNKGLWNGVGGKIEIGETPLQSIKRELLEETEIVLDNNASIQYVGIVSWDNAEDVNNSNKAMYNFIIYLPKTTLWRKKEINEGILEWKSIDWVTNIKNKEIPANMKSFFPHMLNNKKPYWYQCVYYNHQLQKILIKKLPSSLTTVL